MVVPNSTLVAKKSAYSHSGLMVSVIPIDFRITLCTGEIARATIRFTPNCFNSAITNREVPKSFPNTTNTTSPSVKGNVCNACSFFTSNATVFVMESLYKLILLMSESTPNTSFPRLVRRCDSASPKLPNPNTIHFIIIFN